MSKLKNAKRKGKDSFEQEDDVLHCANNNINTSAYAQFSSAFINTAASLGTLNNKGSFSRFIHKPYRQPQHWINMARGSWVAKRAVSVVADDMTSAWRTWRIEDDSAQGPDESVEGQARQKQEHLENMRAIQELVKQERAFQLQKKTNTALKMARLFGGSAFFPIIREDDLSTPLDLDGIGQGDLRFLKVLDPTMIHPFGVWDASLFREETLACEFYLYQAPAVSKEQSILIHRSRLIFFGGEEIPLWSKVQNNLWDDSVLSCIENSILAYHESKELSRAMMMRGNETIVKIPGLWQKIGTPQEGRLMSMM